MNVLPVIARELRTQARQPFTYLMRVYGVAALLAVMVFLMFGDNFGAGKGAELFVVLHRVVLGSIWILIPLGAADCISREKREGTLGLLFLTPLMPGDIVIAKTAAHVLRALTLWFVSLPVQMLPILIGGVTWEYVMFSCVLNFWSISFVVGVSVVASALCQRAPRALGLTATLGAVLTSVLAYVSCLLVTMVFFLVADNFVQGGLGSAITDRWYYYWLHLVKDPLQCLSGFTIFLFGGDDSWADMPPALPTAMKNTLMSAFGVGLLFAFGVSLLLLWIAAKIVRRSWQDSLRSMRVEKIEKTFSKPVFWQGTLKRWLRRKMDRNPVGWLERRSWTGRMVVWIWFALIAIVYSVGLTSFDQSSYIRDHFKNIQDTLVALLALSMAATAAGSFRRERETGVLELLLVTPLSERQIIDGRLRGIWMQFLPSVVLLASIWVFTASIFSEMDASSVLWLIASFMTIPVIGLRCSLRFSGYVAAFIGTIVCGQVIPALAFCVPRLDLILDFFRDNQGSMDWSEFGGLLLFGGILLQFIIAIILMNSLHKNLVQRRFISEH